jgi:soluble lytic murein transglycosylase-like protein
MRRPRPRLRPDARAASARAPRRPVFALVAVALICASACGREHRPAPSPSQRHSASGPASTTEDVDGDPPIRAPLPPPDARLPDAPVPLAATLEDTTTALHAAIDAWVDGPGISSAPPRDVRLLALHQQRLYWLLTVNPRLADRTISRLPEDLAREARATTRAGAKLLSLVEPIMGNATLETQRPESAASLLAYYREAEARFGVDWEVLAAVNFVESRFGRARSASPAGARGPMQFVPATWRAYGLGGDIRDPHDAILGAANFLRSGGAPERYRRALYYYNHAWSYVDAVLLYARQMMRDAEAYLAYYNWPVVVLTTRGPQRLTGPRAE